MGHFFKRGDDPDNIPKSMKIIMLVPLQTILSIFLQTVNKNFFLTHQGPPTKSQCEGHSFEFCGLQKSCLEMHTPLAWISAQPRKPSGKPKIRNYIREWSLIHPWTSAIRHTLKPLSKCGGCPGHFSSKGQIPYRYRHTLLRAQSRNFSPGEGSASGPLR